MPGTLVTVVVPAWRDLEALEGLLSSGALNGAETTVSVPLGEAAPYAQLLRRHPSCRLVTSPRGRAVQMNAGAAGATGRWLLFLHADSRPSAAWQAALRQLDPDPRIVGGAFRFALESRDWRARVLEAGVRIRVRLLHLPYGDQGIFVRRDVFERMGGFADVPLMEDVELVRRLRRYGRLFFTALPVVTSARRWERDGWLRRSLANMTLASRYMLGASPSALARCYFGRSRSAVVVMARAPWERGKTRIFARDEEAHLALREALLLDTLDVVTSVRGVDRLVACQPDAALLRLQRMLGADWDMIAQRGDSLGARLSHAFSDALRLGYESLVVIGSDLPDLPARHLAEACEALDRDPSSLVLGPAIDGGYYLIGMNTPRPELFEGIDWSTGRVLEQTLAIARRIALRVTLLDSWSDVDTDDDLSQVASRASTSGAAPRTRAWVARERSTHEEGRT